ncbi:MAG: hypothetical protein JOZ43_04125, partial [Acidobacteriales bacterium]|nr:hypothetical protein [Terriglobales bacterium]
LTTPSSGTSSAAAPAKAPSTPSAARRSSTITLTVPARPQLFRWGAGALVLVAAAIGAWFALGRRAHALTDKDSIVIADFANTTGDQVFDGTLKQALEVSLGQSPYLSVVSEQQVASTLKRMNHKADERVTSALAREICQRNAIKGFVAGNIGSVGSQYLITLQAVNAATGDILAEGQSQASDKDHVLAALSSASNDLRGKLGESLASVKKFDKPLDDATTSSLEALKAYSLAEEKIDREGDNLGAMPLLEHAIQLDPNFAMAHATLGIGYNNVGEFALARQNMRKAFDLSDRVSEKERLHIAANYHNVMGQTQEAVADLEMYRDTYPRDFVPYVNLGAIYDDEFGELEKGADSFRRAIEIDPTVTFPYTNLISTYMLLGRLDEAKAVLQAATAHGIGGNVLHRGALAIATHEHDEATIAREIQFLQGSPGGQRMLRGRLWGQTLQAGKLAEAEKMKRLRADDFLHSSLPDEAANAFFDVANLERYAGLTRLSSQNVDAALKLSNSQATAQVAAAVLAATGDEKRARALLAPSLKDNPEDERLQRDSNIIEAQILYNHGKFADAADRLRPYETYVRVDPDTALLLGYAKLRAGQPADALIEFQKNWSARFDRAFYYMVPVTRLAMARTYVALNDLPNARQCYQDFFAYWKDADPDIPLLQQAKAEYAALNGDTITATLPKTPQPPALPPKIP